MCNGGVEVAWAQAGCDEYSPAEVSVITSIGLTYEFLGDTLEAIAREKAG